jgi:hypothetical protein
MAPVQMTLYRQYYTSTALTYYPIDQGTFSNLLSTLEGKFLIVDIKPTSLITNELCTYNISVTPENPIPRGGYILVTIPMDIQFEESSCLYKDRPTTCAMLKSKEGKDQVKVTGPFIYEGVAGQEGMLIQVTQVRNPRSMKTTGEFYLQSFDAEGLLIDYYGESNTAITMESPATFTLA